MNILSIINKLKEKNFIPDGDDALALFTDSFNKFGISLLLLKDEDKFNQILRLLEEYSIPLQKLNGMYALRIFAVDIDTIETTINNFFAVNEVPFLQFYPEMIAEISTCNKICKNIKTYQDENISYKSENGYDLEKLLNFESHEEVSQEQIEDVNSYLKTILQDPSLIEKLENNIASNDEEDFNVALELQKVENRICEDYLLPVDDGWKIVIDNKEVNSFQEVKNTINTITNLNLSITFQDALYLVLFYKSNLSIDDIKQIVVVLNEKGGN